MESEDLDIAKLTSELQKQTEWSKCVIFNEEGKLLLEKNCKANETELKQYLQAFEDRDQTIGAGFVLLNEHYDVHRFHPPLIYGRRGNADEGEGISLAVGRTKADKKLYMIICYELPIISARAVPQQINFYNNFIGELERFN